MFSDRNYKSKSATRWSAGNYAVPSIILINTLFFLIQQISVTSPASYSYSSITYYFALIPYFIKQFEAWRLFTYMFLHGGFFHLLVNMWGVYIFGSMLEQSMGSKNFLLLYFASGLFAGIFWTLFNWNSPAVCVGASGALFGVMVAAAMLFPNMMIMLLIPPIPLKLKTFAIIYALIETFSAFLGFEANVAHLAHIGGLIAGYVVIRFLYPNKTYDILKPLKTKLHIRQGKGFSEKASKSWTVTTSPRKKLDEILDKISRSGINSLTEEEIAILKRTRESIRAQK